MATTAQTTRKHTRVDDDYTADPRSWFDLFSDSLYDAIPVPNTTARTAMLAALAARTPAIVPAASRPILFEQADLPAGYRFIYTVDGTNFISLSGAFVWANAAARTAATSMAAGDMGYQVDTKLLYRYDGAAWKAWESDWATYAPTVTGILIGTGGAALQSFRWRYQNGLVQVPFVFVLGTTGVVNTAATFTLPVASLTPVHAFAFYDAEGSINDSSAGQPAGITVIASGTSTTIVRLGWRTGTTYGYDLVGAGSPWVWGPNDAAQGMLTYEPA